MRTRASYALSALSASALIVLANVAIPSAGAQGTGGGNGPTGTPTATPGVVLSEADGLVGMSIAAATSDPDTPYTPLPVSQSFGPEGTGAIEEGNTRLTSGDLTSEIVLSSGGVRSVAAVTASICPNDRGVVSAHITMTIGSATGDDRVIEARATGRANDAAVLTSPAVEVVRGKGAEARLLKRSGDAILRRAEKAWRSGYCVKIDVAEGGSRTVKPKEKLPISATATLRFGGGDVGGRMDSKIDGQKKIAPGSASGSPAKFIYTAPDKKPGTGSVELKSTSKRGIGLAHLKYTTEGDLKVDALFQDLWQLTAVKCGGPAGAWDITGTISDFASGSEQITFTLGRESLSGPWHSSGQITAAGVTRGINESGTATFKESPDGTSGTLTLAPSGSVPVTTGTFCTNGAPTGG